jgi:hypothetical protein
MSIIQKFHSMGERLLVLKKMKNEYFRLTTFNNCDMSDLPSAENFARSGMFYFGVKNVTRCAFCFAYFKGWTKNDSPAKIHLKRSPDCPLGKALITGDHYAPNADDGIRIPQASAAVSIITARSYRKRHHMDEHFLLCMGIYTKFPYACPEMVLKDTRIMTFSESVIEARWREPLAFAGFYYSSLEDCLRCYMCDIGLQTYAVYQGRNSNAFKASELHIIGNPHCTHMIMMKGPKWYQEMMKKLYDLSDESFASDLQSNPSYDDLDWESDESEGEENSHSESSSSDENIESMESYPSYTYQGSVVSHNSVF